MQTALVTDVENAFRQKYFQDGIRNENLTKTQIIKTITENQHLPSTSSTQNSSNTKEPSNTRPEMAHNSTIDLTENNKCKPTGSQTRDDNFQAIVNNNNNNKIKRY